jgi:formylglycine-generating enzyme required for sulfatase activity
MSFGSGAVQSRLETVFVAHSPDDADWVAGVLVPALGLEPAAVVTSADFRLGESVVLETERAVLTASCTIVVLTPAFVADEWSVLAELLAEHDTVAGTGKRLVPVLLQPCRLPLRIDFRVVLDCTDEDSWPNALTRLRRSIGGSAAEPEELPCPYPGMTSFRAQDSPYFFGRDDEADELARRLGHQSLVVLIGPSGSGKSSLAFAGVLPRLAIDGTPRTVLTMRPGNDPLPTLQKTLSGSSESSKNETHVLDLVQRRKRDDDVEQLLLVVDQLEECLAGPAEQAAPFLAVLETIRRSGSCTLLITLRADFTSELMTSALWPLGSGERFDVVPLRGGALRCAITRPASTVGAHIEPALVERLINDTEGEPGALPLVQEALVLLWERRFKRYLSLRSYERLGRDGRNGVTVALAIRADATLAGMTPSQRLITRRVLLRLIQLGEGRRDTRGQQTVSTLSAGIKDPAQLTIVLDQLASRRLVVLGGSEDPDSDTTTVDIAHEAMIEGWPALRAWLDESRADELLRRRIERDAAEWRDDHETAALYRGRRLAESLEWTRRHPGEVGIAARSLLAASRRRQRLLRALAALIALALVAGVTWLAVPVAHDLLRRREALALGPTVLLPAGPALLGDDQHVNRPRRRVPLAAFRMERHEVSNGQYRLCVEALRCAAPSESYDAATFQQGKDDLPVTFVTAYQAAGYCAWIGRTLPTVDQWERAAGGLEGRRYAWGDERPTPARVNAIIGGRQPVAAVPVQGERFQAGRTPEGIVHLLGNTAEWTRSLVKDITSADSTDERLQWNGQWDGRHLIHTLAVKGGAFDTAPFEVKEVIIAEANGTDARIGFRCVDIN